MQVEARVTGSCRPERVQTHFHSGTPCVSCAGGSCIPAPLPSEERPTGVIDEILEERVVFGRCPGQVEGHQAYDERLRPPQALQLPGSLRSGRQVFSRNVSCTDCRTSGTTPGSRNRFRERKTRSWSLCQRSLDGSTPRVDGFHHLADHAMRTRRHGGEVVGRRRQLRSHAAGQQVHPGDCAARRKSAGLGLSRPMTFLDAGAIALAADVERKVAPVTIRYPGRALAALLPPCSFRRSRPMKLQSGIIIWPRRSV